MPADHLFNRVIAALTQGARPSWVEKLEEVELPARHDLIVPGEPTKHLHFPTSALLGLSHSSGAAADVSLALVGNDGVLGASGLWGTGAESQRAVVLHPGSAWRLPISAVPSRGPDAAPMVKALVGHLFALTSQISQTAYCQGHHCPEQRLARWLLTACDRLPGDSVAVAPEQLVDLLAVSADALAAATEKLSNAGALVHEPKRLVMKSRAVLLARSCGCHATQPGWDSKS